MTTKKNSSSAGNPNNTEVTLIAKDGMIVLPEIKTNKDIAFRAKSGSHTIYKSTGTGEIVKSSSEDRYIVKYPEMLEREFTLVECETILPLLKGVIKIKKRKSADE